MTYFKTALIASAATALLTTPALAGEMAPKASEAQVQSNVSYNAATNLMPEQRLMWEAKVKAKMSDSKKAKWAAMTEAEQQMWMDKKIYKMMRADGMTGATMANTKMESTLANDTVGEILQAGGDADPEADKKLLMANGDQMKKSVLIAKESDNSVANNAIVVPTIGSDVVTTVSCPVGTTAQADMTCLVTGNYRPTS